MTPPKPDTDGALPASPAPASPLLPRLDSSALFERQREIIIVHRGEEYRLRLTRQEKLILTK